MKGWDWMKAVLLTPTRALLLAAAVVSLVVVILAPDARHSGGWLEASQLAGGVSILTIIFTWRRFWRGPAVYRAYERMMMRRLDRL